MVELQDITGVGESRADDLVEMGYESVEDVAAADPEDLTELSRVGEDRAIEMVVDAQNLAGSEEEQPGEEADSPDEGTESGSETITFDEEENDEGFESPSPEEVLTENSSADEPVEEAVDEERPEEQTFELSFSLDKFESEILTAALIDAYSTLRSRNVSRSEACFRVLEKLRDSTTLQVTEEELNALHSAVRQRRLEYQGNNHVDMMNLTRNIEVQISEARDEYLF